MKNYFNLLFLVVLISCSGEDSIKLEMIDVIKPSETATFLMGATELELSNQIHRENDSDYYFDDEKAHEVILTIPYSIGKFEITNEIYCKVINWAIENGYAKIFNGDVTSMEGTKYLGITNLVEENYLGTQYGIDIAGSGIKPKEKWADKPANAITWYGAVAFCNFLSLMNDYDPVYDLKNFSWDETKNGYRLPTEAEWEYAARKKERFVYAWGNEWGAEYGCSGDFNEATNWTYYFTDVGFFDGTLKENFQTENNSSPFGVYDMTGNVWEWCWDWYGRDYFNNSQITDPKGPEMGEDRPPYDIELPTKVWRGCGWLGSREYSRITKRWSLSREKAINEVGLRVARTLN